MRVNQDEYERKRAAGRDWPALLKQGDHIFVGSAAGEPAGLVDQLLAARASAGAPAVTVVQLPHGGSGRLVRAASPELRFVGIAANPDVLDAVRRESGSYLLSTIWQTARAIRDGRITFDAALVQVAPADSEGDFSLGISVDFALDAARRARLVVAQVNRNLPRTRGGNCLRLDDIDVIVEQDSDLPSHGGRAPDDQARAVARNVVELVPDEATIEIGVGEILTAVLNGLAGHRDLSLHTGLFAEPMIPLIRSGVISNRFGKLPGHASVANQATGAGSVVEFLHDNPAVALMPASYTHDPVVLRSQHRLHALNTAVEVDLLGRVNSEFIDGRRVSSAGGLLDFVRAARESDGGRSVIALRSTARSGTRSKIVARLSAPGSCSVDADLADMVVTEFGIASLADKSADERIRQMIAIADPAFRDRLAEEASAAL